MLKQEYKTHQMLFSDYCIYYSTFFFITLQQISVFVSRVRTLLNKIQPC